MPIDVLHSNPTHKHFEVIEFFFKQLALKDYFSL